MAPEPGRAETRMGAIVRDPGSVFLYWEFSEAVRADVEGELGPGCEWVLRVLDQAGAGVGTIPVAPEAGNQYLVVEPGGTYAFELVARSGGQQRVVCRGGPVLMPPGRPDRRRGVRPPAESSPGAVGMEVDALRAAARGIGVPGLSYESTALFLGSSPSASRRD